MTVMVLAIIAIGGLGSPGLFLTSMHDQKAKTSVARQFLFRDSGRVVLSYEFPSKDGNSNIY